MNVTTVNPVGTIARAPDKRTKHEFSHRPGLLERWGTRVALLFVLHIPIGCGGGGEPRHDDGGRGRDAAGSTDLGTNRQDAIEDAAPISLCSMHPADDDYRVTFNLGDIKYIGGGVWIVNFTEIDQVGGEPRATFAYYITLPPAPQFMRLRRGDRLTRNIADVGATSFELCDLTPNDCSAVGPSGDTGCTATLASDRTLIAP